MRLEKLIEGMECELVNAANPEIGGICCDTREGGLQSALFAALPGTKADGADFAARAAAEGAAAILAEAPIGNVDIAQVIVPDVRAALARISARFHGRPGDRLTLVGVTGTNGKTTTTYLIESILKASGRKTGLVGTVRTSCGGTSRRSIMTTPQAPQLQRMLAEMVDAGVTHCVMEVSSHGLDQRRVDSLSFGVAVFTNLSRDHLDYHGEMAAYFEAKSRLFTELLADPARAAVNIDDPWGARLARRLPGALTYGLGEEGGVRPLERAVTASGIEAVVATPAGKVQVSSPLLGEFNLMNILAAVAAAALLGIEREAVEAGVRGLSRVPGRLEAVGGESLPFRVLVDYAHTADALERALKAVRPLTKGRIITVFGCGGNRDRGKRAPMGEAASRLSDLVIITSDNPRDEDPLEITAEIEAGVKGLEKLAADDLEARRGYMVAADRAEAIRRAVAAAAKGDTVLVAGKGHEEYQQTKGGRKTPFSDRAVIEEAVLELYGEGAAATGR
ncbi:MAG TPA: UDP-N-acetylmuramoyl-L-alanyl-D-glutamate--2,6-diaminopimelate ligase [Deltaproteobacteria bacterium]|nr:UDP-N-acetylmuramoyl-L-alanyl-D-glutamate--2,6-diaminopimelate ligase [Deltaproteobacteria bacterium]